LRSSPAEGRRAYLDLADFLLIAEAALGVSAEDLARVAQLNLAASALAAPAAEFGGVEFYPEFPMKAAVLCSHLIRNHPLPDGNKRVGFLCSVEFAERNGYEWKAPTGDRPGGEETVKVIERVAAGEIAIHDLADWIGQRLKEREERA
jgi:death-on-curing protein